MSKVIILMGSKGDLEHSQKISAVITGFGVPCILRIASAHKVPLKALKIIEEYNNQQVVFITVAGRSNALSGFTDAHTQRPVIACPPYSDKYAGADLYSSLRMPSGVCPLTIIEPDLAGLAAVKILALADQKLMAALSDYQAQKRAELEKDDAELNSF